MKPRGCILFAIAMLATQAQASITGNPVTDGWSSHGNSLENGIYVRGAANYGFETYSASLTVDSALNAASGWALGDVVIGVGGIFTAISATDAGWPAFSGNAVNSLLSDSTGPRIQAKFGTFGPLDTTFSPNGSWGASTIAPGGGNAIGGLAGGHNGAIQVRGPGYVTYAAVDAGKLMALGVDKVTRWTGSTSSAVDASSARYVFNLGGDGELSSWQILLNVTQLGVLNPWSYLPEPGVPALMTVQNNDSAYTDALLNISVAEAVVPEPTTLVVWVGLGLVSVCSFFVKKHKFDRSDA